MSPLKKLGLRLFWWISISPWNWWKVSLIHGPRIQIFRNQPHLIRWRWGFAILGLEIGDRGGRHLKFFGTPGRLWWLGPRCESPCPCGSVRR